MALKQAYFLPLAKLLFNVNLQSNNGRIKEKNNQIYIDLINGLGYFLVIYINQLCFASSSLTCTSMFFSFYKHTPASVLYTI